jgi:hypothetical protein
MDDGIRNLEIAQGYIAMTFSRKVGFPKPRTSRYPKLPRFKLLAGLLASFAVLSASASQAMEWSQRVEVFGERVIIYEGKGPIIPGDAKRLLEKIQETGGLKEEPYVIREPISNSLERAGRNIARSNRRPLVSFNSGGGSVDAGVELGILIRQLGFDTIVSAGTECHSSCTMAFLGGVSRTVIGKYAIHAMAINEEVVKAQGGITKENIYSVQAGASYLIRYAREMVGKSDILDASLRIGLQETIPVGDRELRDWNVITVASRPQQLYPASVVTTLDCDGDFLKDGLGMVRRFTCKDLTLARSEVRLTEALKALRQRPEAKAIAKEQARWIAFRNACEKAPPALTSLSQLHARAGSSEMAVEACLEQAYKLRLLELETLVAYHAARDSGVAKAGWHEKAK